MLALLVALLALSSSSAPGSSAHYDTDSRATVAFGGPALELVLELDLLHWTYALEAPPPRGEDWSEEDLRAVGKRALAYLADHWRLTIDDQAAAWTPDGFELLRAFDPMAQQERALRIAYRFTIASPARDATASLLETLFDGLEPAHRHSILLTFPDRPDVLLAVQNGEPLRFPLPDVGPGASRRRGLARAKAGALSSLSSPWLALFLAALLVSPLPLSKRRASAAAALAAAAAAFALARADLIAPAAWAATASAAFSVVYVVAENRFSREVKLRVATAALFGLVHGMALSSAIPASALPPTVGENAAFGAAALLAAAAAAWGCARLFVVARTFAARR